MAKNCCNPVRSLSGNLAILMMTKVSMASWQKRARFQQNNILTNNSRRSTKEGKQHSFLSPCQGTSLLQILSCRVQSSLALACPVLDTESQTHQIYNREQHNTNNLWIHMIDCLLLSSLIGKININHTQKC